MAVRESRCECGYLDLRYRGTASERATELDSSMHIPVNEKRLRLLSLDSWRGTRGATRSNRRNAMDCSTLVNGSVLGDGWG